MSPGTGLWFKSPIHSDLVLNKVFKYPAGEAIGIMGINGSGKSTLLQIVAGTATIVWRYLKMRRYLFVTRIRFWFTSDFDAIENIKLYGALLGIKRNDLNSYVDGVQKFSELPIEAIKKPVRTYSSGMTEISVCLFDGKDT